MFEPKYMQEYEYFDICELEGLKIQTTKSTGVDCDPNVQCGNCFPVGSLDDHDLAKVEDFIRGLYND